MPRTVASSPALVSFRLLGSDGRLGVARLGWLTHLSPTLAAVTEAASHIPRILRGAEVGSIKPEEGRRMTPPRCLSISFRENARGRLP